MLNASPFPLVIAGHVDHGKSTLIGRLLYDTGSLEEGKFAAVQASSARRNMAFEWAFLLDALQAERDQNVTIDTTQIRLATLLRQYVIIDAPGHSEFLRNMMTGAAQAQAALLIIDVHEGMREQSRRHARLLSLLGITQIAVIINKMDKMSYGEAAFRTAEQACREYLQSLGITPLHVIPASAREGENIIQPSALMEWYKGPCVTAALDDFVLYSPSQDLPLRLPVQDIYKFNDKRILAGRIESGVLQAGDELLFSPSGSKARVASIVGDKAPARACAGQSIAITLDSPVFVERGYVISHVQHAPLLTNILHASLCWLGEVPLTVGKRLKLRIATAEYTAEVKQIVHVVDNDTLAPAAADIVRHGDIAEVKLRLRGLAAVDAPAQLPALGRFVLMDNYRIEGCGLVMTQSMPDLRVDEGDVKSRDLSITDLKTSPLQRAVMNGHTGGIVWFTGLSGSGKSTLAVELEQRLFAKGYQVYVLDGDNIRHGLSRDLGFSPQDRAENIRRVGEVAALFAQAGFIVITAFISPYDEDRRRARAAAPEFFNTVYIKADIATCEKRDAKGLYAKARRGEIAEFTGISAPYEEPENAELVVDTARHSIEECVEQLMRYVDMQFAVADE